MNNCIESFTQVLNNVFLPHCSKEFVVYKTSNYTHCKSYKTLDNKPWFDEKCVNLRRIYLRNLKLFNSAKTHYNRTLQQKELIKNTKENLSVFTSDTKEIIWHI